MISNSVRELYERYDSFLLDMYGVLYNGSQLYEGALDLLLDMKRAGKKVVILSNTTIVSAIAAIKYDKLGMICGVHYDEFITSGDVFSNMLRTDYSGARYFQIFKPNKEIFEGTDLKESSSIKDADFIYVGAVIINGEQVNLNSLVTYNNVPVSIDELYNLNWTEIQKLDQVHEALEKCLKYNKKLFVANPDILAIEKNRGINSPVLCQGGVGEYYESMGGEVVYFGKPYQPIYDYAKRFVNGKIVMVGDTPWTDVLGGNMAEIDTILTLTGVSELYMQNASGGVSDCMRSLLTNVSDRMTHKTLKEFSGIPTHIVKQFAGGEQ